MVLCFRVTCPRRNTYKRSVTPCSVCVCLRFTIFHVYSSQPLCGPSIVYVTDAKFIRKEESHCGYVIDLNKDTSISLLYLQDLSVKGMYWSRSDNQGPQELFLSSYFLCCTIQYLVGRFRKCVHSRGDEVTEQSYRRKELRGL